MYFLYNNIYINGLVKSGDYKGCKCKFYKLNESCKNVFYSIQIKLEMANLVFI